MSLTMVYDKLTFNQNKDFRIEKQVQWLLSTADTLSKPAIWET